MTKIGKKGLFMTPWYTWSISGAIIAFIGAMIVAFFSYNNSKHLKILELLSKFRENIDLLFDKLSLILIFCPDFGKRLDIHTDKIANILNEIEQKSKIMLLYTDLYKEKQMIIYNECHRIYMKIMTNYSTYNGCKEIDGCQEDVQKAGVILGKMNLKEEKIKIEETWEEIIKMSKKIL